MATPAVRIYDALRPTLGDETAKDFIAALDENTVSKIEIMKNDLVTKKDFYELRSDVEEIKRDLKGIADNMKLYVRAEIFRTMAIVGFVQLLAIIASVVAIIRAMIPH